MKNIRLEIEAGLAVVRLDNGVPNGISMGMIADLEQALILVKSQAQGLILAGNPKFFSMGFHLPSLLTCNRSEVAEFFSRFNRVCLDFYTLPLPTIAAVAGHAPAGGTVLALTCDYRFLADKKVVMGLNEIKLGLAVPPLAQLILEQLTGGRQAARIIREGEFLPPAEALAVGMVDELHPAEEVETQAQSKIRRLMTLPTPTQALIKATRTETVRRTYALFGPEWEERWVDLFFLPETQDILRPIAEKF